MPATELCVIHPGALSASSWARLASHLPAGTPVKVLELETINRYWAADPELTVEALADRLRAAARDPARARARGLGRRRRRRRRARRAPSRRVVVLDGLAPGALHAEPREAELLRSFAMYAGARRGRPLDVDPARLRDGLEPALAHILEAASAAGALREDTTPATVERCYEQHAARVLRDHRLIAGYEPSGRAADGRQGRAQPRARQPARSAGTASPPSSCSPAAAITTRCSPTPPPPRTSRCCCGAGSRRLFAAPA